MFLALVLAAVTSVSAASAPAAAGQTPPGIDGIIDYPMTCRMGQGMNIYRFRYSPQSPTTVQYPVIAITFHKAAEASSRQAPGPGECAWADRPITPNEPSVLVFHTLLFGWPFPDRFERDYDNPRYQHAVMLVAWNFLEAAFKRRGELFYLKAFHATRPLVVDHALDHPIEERGSRDVLPRRIGTDYFEISGAGAVAVRIR